MVNSKCTSVGRNISSGEAVPFQQNATLAIAPLPSWCSVSSAQRPLPGLPLTSAPAPDLPWLARPCLAAYGPLSDRALYCSHCTRPPHLLIHGQGQALFIFKWAFRPNTLHPSPPTCCGGSGLETPMRLVLLVPPPLPLRPLPPLSGCGGRSGWCRSCGRSEYCPYQHPLLLLAGGAERLQSGGSTHGLRHTGSAALGDCSKAYTDKVSRRECPMEESAVQLVESCKRTHQGHTWL